MSVIDLTYFQTGETYIPNNTNMNADPEGTPSFQTKIQNAIDKYERDLLLNALGVNLYKELVTALDGLNESKNAKWKKLVEGEDYTIDGNTYSWEGLRGFNKDSLVAFYVFCKYLIEDERTYTTTGIVANEASNAERAEYLTKYVPAHNSFRTKYQGIIPKLQILQLGHPIGKIRILTEAESRWASKYHPRQIQASLWQYLCDQNQLDPTSFPDFQFRIYNPVNRFGI